jgi:hypothetical protein
MDHEPSSAPLLDDSHGTPRPNERDSATEMPVSRPDPTPTPPVDQTQDRDARKDGNVDGQSALPTVMPPRPDKADKGQDDRTIPEQIKPITPDAEIEETVEPARRPPVLPSKAAPAAQDAVLGPGVTPGLSPKDAPPEHSDPPQPERPQVPIPPSNRGKSGDKDHKDEERSVPPALPSKEIPPVPVETLLPEEEDTTLDPSPDAEEPADADDGNGAPGGPPALPSKAVPPGLLDKPQPTEIPRPKKGPPLGSIGQDIGADEQVSDGSEAFRPVYLSPKSTLQGPTSSSIAGRNV